MDEFALLFVLYLLTALTVGLYILVTYTLVGIKALAAKMSVQPLIREGGPEAKSIIKSSDRQEPGAVIYSPTQDPMNERKGLLNDWHS